MRQFLAVQANSSFQRQVADTKTCPNVRQQVVVDVLGHTLLEVVDGISRLVANGKIGVFVGIVEIIGAIGIIDADNGWHQQGIDKTVGNASRIWRRVEDMFLGSGQSFLLRATIGGIETKFQVLLQLPLHVSVEIITLET